MQRRTWIIAVAIIGALALVGLIATLSSRHGENQPSARSESPSGGPSPSNGSGTVSASNVFSFHRLEIDTSHKNGEACLVFTADLDASGKTRYTDYLTLNPSVPVEARPQGNRLCLAGLSFGTDYTATLRAGLPSAKAEMLKMPETVPVSLRDRQPFVGFGDGLILPRSGTDGVPITSVNVKSLEIQVIRVNDRLLSQLRSDLVNERLIYGYDRQQMANEQGREIWHGAMDVRGAANDTVVTLFPLREAIKAGSPGVYLITARDAAKKTQVTNAQEGDSEDWQGRASQWVVDTDIGLTTYVGTDGLHAFARALSSAAPISGLELALVARDNGELQRLKTDGDGAAFFPAALMRGAGGAEPVLLMAYGKNGDFAYADLRRPAFDLSDRGVSGRASPGPVDAYLYTERGIYRAGETVQLVTLLRDREARALSDMPVTLVVRRPDGVEYRRLKAGSLKAGGAATALALTPTAPRGHWSISAYLNPDDKAVGSATFDVQDFVPERLKVTLEAPKHWLKPGDEFEIPLEARFLYGAPASNLGGTAEMRLIKADKPFPSFAGYSFGLAEEAFSQTTSDVSVRVTDAEGKGVASGHIDSALASSAPLSAQITVALNEPGGRTTREQTSVPVLTGESYVGIRALFADNQVAENAEAKFEVITVDPSGKQIARNGLRYELFREDTDYQWYQADGQWRYDAVTRDKLIQTGMVNTTISAAAILGERVQFGAYRIVVRDDAGKAATSVRFYGGWGAGGSENRPDRIIVSSQSPSYSIGQKASIALRPPVPGKALIVLASDKIIATKFVDVPQGGTEVSFDVTNEWGSGVYALVTLYRPLAGGNSPSAKAPARAIGLTWLGVDTKERTLALDIEAPSVARPRTSIQIPIQVKNARPGEAVAVTLAAVDEGILQLTDYTSPAPSAYYFGKRKLGLDIRDDYGRLIEANGGTKGPIRSGGDGIGGRGLAAVPQRTVALFSGLLEADARGRVIVPLNIPDFVGELRLMATAFAPARLGEAAKPLTVRDAVVADLTLPRFLAPGDDATATLLLDNVEGPNGNYRVTVNTKGSVSQASTQAVSADLAQHQRKIIGIPIKAGTTGLSTIALTLEGPNGLRIPRSWPIEVRPAALPDFKETVAPLKPNEEAKLDPALISAYLPQTASLTVTVGGNKGFDVPGLLKWLDRYPYGCIEQTTSRALPLLYADKLAISAGLATNDPVERRVQEAVDRVIDMQMSDGAFGMWSAHSEPADAWIGVFAADFLSEAKAKNYVVADSILRRTQDWLRQIAGNEQQPDGVRAYALYVLARAGAVPIGDARYFYDTTHAKFKTGVAPAFAAAALSELGDKARAADGFAKAREMVLQAKQGSYEPLAYGSLLRDVSAVTAVAAAAGETSALPQLIERVASLEPPIDLTTTQEKAWLVRAAAALDAQAANLAIDVKGTRAPASKGRVILAPSAAELTSGVTLLNKGTAPVLWTATAAGTPAKPAPATASGITVDKRYLTLDGDPIDLGKVKQSTRVIVSIRGEASENVFRNAAVLDLLPAGFEIEAPIEPLANGDSPYPFLSGLTQTTMAEARDDRFVAAFTLGDRYVDKKRLGIKPTYHVAYVVRAVTPGHYVLPGALAEDMYHPDIRARTAGGTLIVNPAE